MNIARTPSSIRKTRNFIWLERLVYTPIKIGIAYYVYTTFDDGLFFIPAYLLFCLGEQSARHFVNTRELEAMTRESYEDMRNYYEEQNTRTILRLEKLEDLSLENVELIMRIEDLEENFK